MLLAAELSSAVSQRMRPLPDNSSSSKGGLTLSSFPGEYFRAKLNRVSEKAHPNCGVALMAERSHPKAQ
jgi:hypothetical protein